MVTRPLFRPETKPFYLLLGIEAFAFAWLSLGYELMGDYYTPSLGLSLMVSLAVGLATLWFWRWATRKARQSLSSFTAPALRIHPGFVWAVLAMNVAATLGIDYGRVGYVSVPYGFLFTIFPLDTLVLAYFCLRRRIDWPLMLAYLLLGLLRGWTSHIFLMFLAVLLMSNASRQTRILVTTGLLVLLLFEPMMALRAQVRGFDDANGGILYRVGSRLALTPIIDYVINNLPAILICNSADLATWHREMLAAVIPRGILGESGGQSINYCVAAAASGDPNVEITFSTTLVAKLMSIGLFDPTGGVMATVAMAALLWLQVRLARRTLGAMGYVYVAALLHVFLVSGVVRDLVIPTYFLALLWVIQAAQRLLRRREFNTGPAPQVSTTPHIRGVGPVA